MSSSKLSGKRRTFEVTISKTARIFLDESVIAQGLMKDNPIFGNALTGDREHDERLVLEHLAFNLVGNDLHLSMIDGYANCPDGGAQVDFAPWGVDDIVEVTSKGKRR